MLQRVNNACALAVEGNQRIVKQLEQSKDQITGIPAPPLQGSLVYAPQFPTQLLRLRPVDLWLPAGYDAEFRERCPVTYMHDGQLIFHYAASFLAVMDVFLDVKKVMQGAASSC